MGWYLTITEDMRAAGLAGNALLVFALVHGYSQEQQGCYYGSLSHTAKVVGCTPETARTTLKSLTEDGYITRFEFMDNGVRRVAYRTSQKIWGTQKIWEDHPKNLGGGTQKIWDNNKGDISMDKKEGIYNTPSPRFVKPTVEQVRAYCEERQNGIDAQAFIDHYTSNGWKVGNAPMKDWKAAVRTWENRRRESRPARRQQESVYEHNARVLQGMFGQAPDEQ